ncbi:1379aa71-ffbd-4048-878b-fc5d60cd9660 [Sclerotinia trifoliorum]|uniref:1379aa71-ffbd-4048-878b-fc5d60cd9660 n=1 Tax=Sclerotinia trifoliorum TaxID=28548 RepID=A0A8H2W2H0_9HELO|nr:1379aa71-ffbd-4048-878b-fc5d60cd9660 [Sclerotinia trifoliorum]
MASNLQPSTSYTHNTYNILRHIDHIKTKFRTLFHKHIMSRLRIPKLIPDGLEEADRAIYQKIIDTVGDLRKENFVIPHVVVITDLGKDYDDLTAMIVLKELHRLGAIKLEGFVANLFPADKRAHLGRRALDLLGLQDVPVGEGTKGTDDPAKSQYYEFPPNVMGKEPYPIQPEGLKCLMDIKAKAESEGFKLTFCLISSLQDICEFERQLQPQDLLQPHPLKQITAKVVLQGAYNLENCPGPQRRSILKADRIAANNDFNWPAAEAFHSFLDREKVPSVVYTKTAAYDSYLRPSIFEDMSKTGQALGIALKGIEGPQNTRFYEGSCNMVGGKPAPFMPGRDQQWFLSRRTHYFDNRKRESNPELLPKGAEILKYCKVIVYDALAALGTLPEAILDALDVLENPNYEKQPAHNELHRVVGIKPEKNWESATQDDLDKARSFKDEENPFKSPASTTGNMKKVLEALLMGAMLDCKSRGIGYESVDESGVNKAK